MMPAAAQLALDFDAAAASDAELVDEVLEGFALLAMGSDDGIAAHVAARLRGRRLAAARELVRRWEVGT